MYISHRALPANPQAEAWLDWFSVKNIDEFVGRAKLSPNTKKAYRHALMKMMKYRGPFMDYGDTPQITVIRMLEGYLSQMKCRKKSFDTTKAIIKAFCKWARVMGLVDYEVPLETPWPATRSEYMEEEIRDVRRFAKVLEHKDVLKLLEWCRFNSPREWLAIHLLYFYGLRQAEVTRLQRKHVVYIQGRGYHLAVMAKGRIYRLVQLDREHTLYPLATYCRQEGLLEPTDYLFPRKVTNVSKALFNTDLPDYETRLIGAAPVKHRNSINDAIQKAFEQALGTKKHVTSHWFRRSFATMLRNRGHDMYDIMRHMGWRNEKTVLRYYDMSNAAEKIGLNKLMAFSNED